MQANNANMREVDTATMLNAAQRFREEQEQRQENLDMLSSTLDSDCPANDSSQHFGLTDDAVRDFTGFPLTVIYSKLGNLRNFSSRGKFIGHKRIWQR